MKTIGLIGGMSWVSTMDYYRIINEMVQTRLGGASSAEILLHSVDFAPIERMQENGDWDGMGTTLAKSARTLEKAGADCVLICTNTMHKVAPAVEAAINIPLIHIADAAAQAIKSAGLDTIALLGTRYTMEQAFMRERLESNGVQIIVPSFAERRYIHNIIYRELVKNIFTAESRKDYIEIMGDLHERGAQGMLLACTEIPMLVKQDDTSVPLFDTTYEHAKAAVEFAFAKENETLTVAPPIVPPDPPRKTNAVIEELESTGQLSDEELIEQLESLIGRPAPKPVAAAPIAETMPIVDEAINQLQAVFGGETESGYGSAVFVRQVSAETPLESAAKIVYQAFAPKLFSLLGDTMWTNWSEVYRASGGRPTFHNSLVNHDDFQVSMQAGMLINNHDDPDAARSAFRAAFAASDISEQRVYYIGDGDAYGGLIIASRRHDGTSVFLLLLMD